MVCQRELKSGFSAIVLPNGELNFDLSEKRLTTAIRSACGTFMNYVDDEPIISLMTFSILFRMYQENAFLAWCMADLRAAEEFKDVRHYDPHQVSQVFNLFRMIKQIALKHRTDTGYDLNFQNEKILGKYLANNPML